MNTMIPPGTVEQQVRAALKDGRTAEQAAAEVMAPYRAVLKAAGNDSLAGYAHPAVLYLARRLARQAARRAEDKAFGAAPQSPDRLRLARLEFHTPSGEVVAWEDATAEQHEARVLWLQTYIGSLETDLRRHERALKLLRDHGADRLSDISGWEALIGDDLDGEGTASGETVA